MTGARRLAVVGIAWLVTFCQVARPTFVFDSQLLNGLMGFATGLILPWWTIITVYHIGGRWSKVPKMIATLLILPAAIWTLGFVFASMMSGFGQGEVVWRDTWRGSVVKLYRTSGGATTPSNMELRQEKRLLPGVLLVRDLDRFNRCYSVAAATTDEGVTLAPDGEVCDGLADYRRTYSLKAFVYF